MFLISRQ